MVNWPYTAAGVEASTRYENWNENENNGNRMRR